MNGSIAMSDWMGVRTLEKIEFGTLEPPETVFLVTLEVLTEKSSKYPSTSRGRLAQNQ